MEEYIVVDLEMTGLKVTQERIIEIGAVHVCNGGVTDAFSRLVNPARKLSERIVELTGITDAMVSEEPMIETVLPEFMMFAGDLPLVGHNLMFDYAFLKQNAANLHLPFERCGVDTLKIARKFLPKEQNKKLGALARYYKIEQKLEHRAYDDAKATALIYEKLKAEFQSVDESAFEQKPLQYAVKKQSAITLPQKRDLNHLLEYHKINPNMDIARLTRSEASKMIHQIQKQYGGVPRGKQDEQE